MHYTVRTPKVFLPSVWPLPRSLATTGGISVDFSSSPYLDVSVQAVPLICLCIQHMMTRLSSCRIAPFGHPRIYRSLTAPRGFSQLVTSFFGSRCQGIPLVLFVAWPFILIPQRIGVWVKSKLLFSVLTVERTPTLRRWAHSLWKIAEVPVILTHHWKIKSWDIFGSSLLVENRLFYNNLFSPLQKLQYFYLRNLSLFD